MDGWKCPVCGKGLAPWVSECSCIESIPDPTPKPVTPWPDYARPGTDGPYPWQTDKVTCDPIWMIDMNGTQI